MVRAKEKSSSTPYSSKGFLTGCLSQSQKNLTAGLGQLVFGGERMLRGSGEPVILWKGQCWLDTTRMALGRGARP